MNADVLRELELAAVPGGPEPAYAIDAYELHTHPDLGERLLSLAEGVAGASGVGVYGVACLLDDAGVIRVVARGTSGLWVRAEADDHARLVAADAWAAPELGPDWVRMDAWQTVLPFAEGTALLRSRIARAFPDGESPDA